MNKNNQEQQKKVGFPSSKKLWTIGLIMAVAAGITIIAATKNRSTNTRITDNSVVSKTVNKNQIVTHLNDESFSAAINSGVVLVDFWATWCAPCRTQGPVVDKVAAETKGKVKVCKLDVDQNPQTSNKYGIMNIPTILIFNNGNLVEKFVGLQQKQTLMETLAKYTK